MGFRCQVWGFSTKFCPKLKTAIDFSFFAGIEWRTYRRFSTFKSAASMARCLRSQSLLCKVRLWIYTRSLHWILHEAAFYFANCNETNCARFPAGALLLFRFLRIPAFMWTFFSQETWQPILEVLWKCISYFKLRKTLVGFCFLSLNPDEIPFNDMNLKLSLVFAQVLLNVLKTLEFQRSFYRKLRCHSISTWGGKACGRKAWKESSIVLRTSFEQCILLTREVITKVF